MFVLSYIYISTIFYNILLCQSGQGYGYIWQVKGHKILCHFINTADKWCLVNGQQLWMWFGTFTHACTAPQWMVVGNWHLQGRQPSPWGRSPVSFGQIDLGSVFQGNSQDKGPSSLALPRMVHHQWPAAPDVIWHIYSNLYCSSRDGGRDLLSSGESAPTMGQVPCKFWADRPHSFFSQQLLMWFGTFTLGSAASMGFSVWTFCLQWMLLSPWGRSPVSFEQELQDKEFMSHNY